MQDEEPITQEFPVVDTESRHPETRADLAPDYETLSAFALQFCLW